MSASIGQQRKKKSEFELVQKSLRELSMRIDDMRTQINQLTITDEPKEEEPSHEEEEELKANPWIWTGSKRPRPVPPLYVQECQKNFPTNIKSMLQKVLVQDIAISNWLNKRPVLISAEQSIERVCRDTRR